MKVYLYLILFFLLLSCQTKKEDKSTGQKKTISLQYANGFNIEKEGDFTYITVSNPWPEADKPFVYLLAPKGTTPTKNKTYDAFISVPISRLVVTSTTHIPALEALGVLNTLVGFPDTRYISSEAARKRIDNGSITELGVNESINTEILLELAPEVVIGFSINNQNKTYQTIERSGIPVVYNGDWNETSPLGKAEWIKFFAPFFQKESLADSLFNEIKSNYQQAKEIAANATKRPTVFSGAMYKDVWYLPQVKAGRRNLLRMRTRNIYGKTPKEQEVLPLVLKACTTQQSTLTFGLVHPNSPIIHKWNQLIKCTWSSRLLNKSISIPTIKL